MKMSMPAYPAGFLSEFSVSFESPEKEIKRKIAGFAHSPPGYLSQNPENSKLTKLS